MNIKRSFVLAASLITLVVSACSQPSDLPSSTLTPQFGTTAGDGAYGVTKYGSAVYVVGTTWGNLHGTHKGGGDAYIRKLDTSGKLLWGRQFGSDAADYAHDVTTDANGNAYVFGSTMGDLARPLRVYTDLFLRKYTPSGTAVWTRQMGLDTADYSGGVAVSGNSVYVVGLSQHIGTFVYRFGLNGGIWWKKQFSTYGEHAGHPDITADGSGNIYVAGTIDASCEHWSSCTDVQLNKYNASGSLAWSKRLNYDDEDKVRSITAYGSSVYIAMERYAAYDDDRYTYLVKLDASGIARWDKYVSVASVYDPPVSIHTDLSADASGVYTASSEQRGLPDDPSPPTYSVAKFDTNSSLIWRVGAIFDYNRGVGEFNKGSLGGIVARGSSGVYIAGTVDGGPTRGNEALLKRLNASTGSTVWKR